MRKNVIKTINLNKEVRKKIFKKIFFLCLIGIFLNSILLWAKRETNVAWLRNCYFAHRGLFNEEYPENSIIAFQNAIENDFAIELDIQFTKDKKVIVFHDYTLERLTGDKRNVSDLTYEEIKKLNLLNTKEKIPLLEDVLELVDGRAPILIEIKNCNDIINLGNETAKLLEGYTGKYAIQSFDPCVLKWYKKNNRDVLVGQLIGSYKGVEKFSHCKDVVIDFKNFFLDYKMDFLSIDSYDIKNLSIKTFRFFRIPILSWTIRSESELKNIKEFVDGFIFDSFIPEKDY